MGFLIYYLNLKKDLIFQIIIQMMQWVFGFVSERLLDVWINTNNISYTNQPYIFMEKQNWFIKGINFVKRKVCN